MSACPPLDAVVFDAGGTLVRLDFEWMCEQVSALGFPLGVEQIRRGEVEGRRAYDASAGIPLRPGDTAPPLGSRGSIEVYFAAMLATCGASGAVTGAAVGAFLARQLEHGLWMKPVEGARGMLDRLARLGVRLACVSNSDGRAESTLAACGVREGLEFVVDSHLVGIEKPDPRIFHVALDRMGVAPGRALYVGDIVSVDADGARAAGMQFVLIDPFGDYAPRGVASIATIQQLPEFLSKHFEVSAPANAEAASVPHRAGP